MVYSLGVVWVCLGPRLLFGPRIRLFQMAGIAKPQLEDDEIAHNPLGP